MTAAFHAEASFGHALEYIRGWTGISLPESKHRPLRDYLAGFDRDATFTDISARLEADPEEQSRFLGIVTINETYFFREHRQFALLRSRILPALAALGRPLSFWSAACATGEEALSLAALGRNFLGRDDFVVHAGDINPAALARCAEGRYGPNSVREDGREFLPLLEPFVTREGQDIVVGEELRRMVRYSPLNLADSTYSGIPDDLDLVLMRNVLMYMSLETRLAIVDRVAAKMAAGGHIFFSSSDVPHLSNPSLALEEVDGVFFFRKRREGETRSTAGFTTTPEKSAHAPAAHAPAAHARVPVTTKTVADLATMRFNNPLFDEPESPAFDAAIQYLEAARRLGTGGEVMALVIQAEERWGVNSLSRYLAGMAMREDQGQALAAFREAARLDDGFWPARLRIALHLESLRHRDTWVRAEARAEFAACATGIEAYLAAGRCDYEFIMEGFSARYFLELCRGWTRKLDAEGAGHGPR